MNRTNGIIFGVLIALVIVFGGLYFAYRKRPASMEATGSQQPSSSTRKEQPMAASPPSATQNSTVQSGQDQVTIANMAFTPATITVKAGGKVTWMNSDSVTHTVTESDSMVGPSSGDLSAGSSYSFVFSKAGTYHYHCRIHPSMTGTVIVSG